MNFMLTPRAKKDLQGIWSYTSDRWGQVQAEHYITELYHRFEWLAEYPKLGKHRPDIEQGYYCYPHQHHVIFYLCTSEHIAIIGVLHKSMDVIDYFEHEG